MSEYEIKKKALFDCLSSAEKCIEGTSLEQKQFERNPAKSSSHQPMSRRYHGKESIFKRPEAPISKCLRPRRMPDYQLNPDKWKKYSLDDADISDRTNTSAAFAFLAEIERRKDAEQDDAMDTDDHPSGKIVFKKRTNANERKPSFNHSASLRKDVEHTSNVSDEKSILKGSKVVMPEYVIGQKVSKKTKKKLNTAAATDTNTASGQKKPLLQHLFDEEEEEEE